MAREAIRTQEAPASALYSQGVKAGSHVFVSGMVGIDPSTGALAGTTIEDQTRQHSPTAPPSSPLAAPRSTTS